MDLLSQNAFAAYVVHNFFVVTVQIVMCNLNTNAYIKFVIASSLACICAFITAFLLRKIPGMKKIL